MIRINLLFIYKKNYRLYNLSNAINTKGKENSIESLFMSLIFEQYKKLIFNSNHNQHHQHQQQLFK